VFLWAGDLVSNTLLVHLQSLGFTGMSFGVGILVEDIAPALLRRKSESRYGPIRLLPAARFVVGELCLRSPGLDWRMECDTSPRRL
jgi:hypothetical protein